MAPGLTSHYEVSYTSSAAIQRTGITVNVALPDGGRTASVAGAPACSTLETFTLSPNPAAWTPVELLVPIAHDAQSIDFGLILEGKGRAWIDGLTVDIP